ncbi:hypothetical protein [Chitinophaga caeni]|uniref:hypothetical protein n=1 Tax=Chitinophaga caeni TaxID=2029983 RepID=UPI0012FE12FD|nr:hypothetical protein [Chitinophaga caeni]
MKCFYLSFSLLTIVFCQTSVAQYIVNQKDSIQSANFKINGTGTASRFTTSSAPAPGSTAHIGFTSSSNETSGRRWNFNLEGLETGGTAGSNFTISSFNDAGNYLLTPFSINRSTGYVGIGTTNPTARLDVRGTIHVFNDPSSQSFISLGSSEINRWAWVKLSNIDPNSPDGIVLYENNTGIGGGSGGRILIKKEGYVGIGTLNPSARLHVSNGTQSVLLATGTNTSPYTLSIGANDDGVNISNNSSYRGFKFNNANGALFTISNQGNVCIGTTDSKGYKLAVNGDAVFTKVKVKAVANWPDYVFDKNYPNPSLEDIGSYIKLHKHLPGIPTAEEVQQNGVDLGEINTKLLQKIEELTLHMIEMDKEIKRLEQKLENRHD